MTDYLLKVHLVSDTTFGRGDAVAGLVDAEIEYDAQTGMPYMRGRQLKGLLVEECANILYSLEQMGSSVKSDMQASAQFLFGRGGSQTTDNALLHIGHAMLPEGLRSAVKQELNCGHLTIATVLDSLTAIRRQTAVDDNTGTPEDKTLRSMRVLLRELDLYAPLTFDAGPNDHALGLLAACAAGVRRAGTGRNRGRGRIAVSLLSSENEDLTPQALDTFAAWIQEPS